MTSYAYDDENNLLSITDANNHMTSFGYDNFGRVKETDFPSGKAETYTYDAVGNLLTKTDRNGRTITYSYDNLYRLYSKQYPDSTSVSYSYDLADRLLQASDATGRYGFSYDNIGRLTGTTTQYSFLPGQTYSNGYAYDAASNRTSFTAPDGTTNTYLYDTLNQLSTLTVPATGQFGFAYDALGRRTSLTRPNAVNTSYAYDTLSRLLSVLHKAGPVTIDGASYTYDNAGNRLSKLNELDGVTANYTYDLLYQLKRVQQLGGQNPAITDSFTYDAVGNRLSSLNTASYSVNASNEVTSSSDATNYTYDNNGNALTKTANGNSTAYMWDFENRLTQVTLPQLGGLVRFTYDPLGRRIQKSGASVAIIYLYDGANSIEDLDGSGSVLSRYSQGAGIDEPLAMMRSGITSFYNADGIGSITSMTNATGALAQTYNFSAFGKPVSSSGSLVNVFQYAGRAYDQETGLYYNRARYYDPVSGRFLAEDETGVSGYENVYRYARNNPTNLVDPSGLRDVYIVIWNKQATTTSVGHVVAMNLDGTVDLSQFPTNHSWRGQNSTLDWLHSYQEEGRDPDSVFKVHVPNDAAFDRVAKNRRERNRWNFNPKTDNQTNCVESVDSALNAGGVPVGIQLWPGNLGDKLNELSRRNSPNQPWSVQQIQLKDLPGPIRF